MDQPGNSNHWRQMFGREQHSGAPGSGIDSRLAGEPRPAFNPFDDGYDPATRQATSPSPEALTDATALALALDAPDYRPWILQRGRTRPTLMLHLRRFDSRSRLWMGWAVAYPHLVALEYTGDHLLSLDFGARQFMLEGEGFSELVDHLQTGHVVCVQEYAPSFWSAPPNGPRISAIRLAGVP